MYEHDQNVARGLRILKKLLIAYLQFKCNQASWGRHYFYFVLFFFSFKKICQLHLKGGPKHTMHERMIVEKLKSLKNTKNALTPGGRETVPQVIPPTQRKTLMG